MGKGWLKKRDLSNKSEAKKKRQKRKERKNINVHLWCPPLALSLSTILEPSNQHLCQKMTSIWDSKMQIVKL